jgi:hypothetical protein
MRLSKRVNTIEDSLAQLMIVSVNIATAVVTLQKVIDVTGSILESYEDRIKELENKISRTSEKGVNKNGNQEIN